MNATTSSVTVKRIFGREQIEGTASLESLEFDRFFLPFEMGFWDRMASKSIAKEGCLKNLAVCELKNNAQQRLFYSRNPMAMNFEYSGLPFPHDVQPCL